MAWDFDGSTDFWKSSSFSGPSASDKCTLGVWFKPDGVAAAQTLLAVQPASSSVLTFSVVINANAGITVSGKDSADTVLLAAATANNVLAANTSYWLGLSVDLTNSYFILYLNNTDVSPTPSTIDAGNIDWTKPVWSIGAADNGSGVATNLYDGEIEEVVMWPGQYLDITDSDNRDMLIDHRNLPRTPVSYDLATQTFDADPALYYSAAWLENLGSGSDLTRNGTPSYSYFINRDRNTAQALLGEKWGKCDMCGWNFPMSQLKEELGTGLLLCVTGPHDYPHHKSRNEEGWKQKGFFV